VELLTLDGDGAVVYNLNDRRFLMRRTARIWFLLAAATPALALVNIKAGYTSTLGELGDRYQGGIGAAMEIEVGLPGPVAIVPMGGYTQLGEDQQFTDLLNQYIDQYWPPGIPIPPQLQNLGKINSSMFFFGAGVRVDVVKNVAVRFYGEGGVGYYYRDMEAQGVPLSLIGSFVPEFQEFAVDPVSGVGFHADVGLELFPVSPLAPQLGVRYIHALDIGRTTVDDFMAAHVPGFVPPTSKNVDLVLFYAGLGIF
jgi:hypothetical protein